jgi:hypothetical protein
MHQENISFFQNGDSAHRNSKFFNNLQIKKKGTAQNFIIELKNNVLFIKLLCQV